MSRYVSRALVLLLSAAATVTYADGHSTLWSRCASMNLHVVDDLGGENATRIGLTIESVSTVAEARLRSARIFTNSADNQMLKLEVDVAGSAFIVLLSLDRYVPDTGYGVPGGVTLWYKGTIDNHGGYAQNVVNAVSLLVDRFIVAYLKANEADCG